MARPKKSRGFTLVELLVVITIIGMLVSLLLPAIQAAREAGRRSVCQNNMRQCALALTQVEGNKKAYPGYVNAIATGDSTVPYLRASWVVMILPQLERNDLYQNWMNPTKITATSNFNNISGIAAANSFFSPLDLLVCPSNSNPDLGGNPLSYVVNTGLSKTPNDVSITGGDNPTGVTLVGEDVNSGVFFNNSKWDGTASAAGSNPQPGLKVGQDFISTRDGATYTLMMSENLQAGNWALDPNVTPATNPPVSFYNTDLAVRQNTGMVWFLTGKMNNASDPSAATGPSSTNFGGAAAPGINDYSQLATGAIRAQYVTTDPFTQAFPHGLAFSRPSANHSGGVNVAYCGGNAGYLNEEIDYKVYTQLMTPNQKQVDVSNAGAATPILAGSPAGWDNAAGGFPFYILDESAF